MGCKQQTIEKVEYKMNVDVTVPKVNNQLKLGDVIVHPYGTYLVCVMNSSDGKYYVAKNFEGEGGLFGVYESLEELNRQYVGRNVDSEATIYKASEYTLQLVKKDGAE
jgi:hypothetical protein